MWGATFERVYRAATNAIVWPPGLAGATAWTCGECRTRWTADEHDPGAHDPECSLYLPPGLARELVSAIESRQREA